MGTLNKCGIIYDRRKKKEFNEFLSNLSEEERNTALKWVEMLYPETNEETIEVLRGVKTTDEPATDEERKRAQEILEMPDEEFSKMEVYRKGKCICVRTPSSYWMCLMGRLWLVDIENNDKILWCLN